MNTMLRPGFASRLALRVGICAAVFVTATVTTSAVNAETLSALPKGYTSDEPALDAAPPAAAAQAPGAAAAPQAAAVAPQAAPAAPQMQPVADYADDDPSALTEFREPLAAHGAWVDDPRYGTIWVPNRAVVGADFAPYQTAGHWALDANDDWIWVSDYDWGYIPFHYGRWVWIDGRGWSWIPGRQYAPAWVTWRTGADGYIGWAPMPPTYYWSGGYAVGFWAPVPAAYVFVSTSHVFHRHVHTYVIHDHARIRYAASRTRPYRVAQPTGRAGSSGRASYRAASPSLRSAGIAPSAAPRRVSGDSRALAFAKPSGSTRAQARTSAAGGARAAQPRTSQPRTSTASSWSQRHGVTPRGASAATTPRSTTPSSRSVAPARSARSALPSHAVPSSRPSAPRIQRQPSGTPRSITPRASRYDATPRSAAPTRSSGGSSYSAPSRGSSYGAPRRPTMSGPTPSGSSSSSNSARRGVTIQRSAPSHAAPIRGGRSGGHRR